MNVETQKHDDYVLSFLDLSDLEDQWENHLGLLPENSERFAEKRKKEFIAGRLCALNSLSILNKDFNLAPPVGENREPLWPSGIVGAISHTKIQAAAIVSKNLSHLGIDIEAIIEPERFNKISTQFIAETERGIICDDPYRGTIVFSAKESLFKALYPSVKTFFGFLDAQVIEITRNSFTISLLREDSIFQPFKAPISGQFWERNGEIVTLISIPK